MAKRGKVRSSGSCSKGTGGDCRLAGSRRGQRGTGPSVLHGCAFIHAEESFITRIYTHIRGTVTTENLALRPKANWTI